jgi:thiol-disulfide isomerase/thioredoxin
MKKIIIVIGLLIQLSVNAQQASTIHFSTAKNWHELLSEAKASNKTIFIDAYATWCSPCKKMDREVFTEKAVTDYVNANFVAIRVQMDVTDRDNESIKKWQIDAENWKKYITGYPCYLFFTSDGNFAGVEDGFQEPAAFLGLLKKSIDPEESYLAQIRKFKEGELIGDQLLSLSYRAKKNKDPIAISVARTYNKEYLDAQPFDSLLRPKTCKFAEDFYKAFNAKDRLIRFMNKQPEVIDSLAGWKNHAMKLSDFIITQDYINTILLPGGVPIKTVPHWNDLLKRIEQDFDGKTADRVVLNSKIAWAQRHSRTEEAIKYEFEKIDKYGLDTTAIGRGFFNNMIYGEVFTKVNDLKLLKKAASLMEYVNKLENHQNSGYLDTYASILYKAEEKSKAVEIENMALALATQRDNKQEMKIFADTIQRMEKGEEIWKEAE